MKRYLLDTAPLAAYVLGRPSAVALLQPWVARRETTTSILCQAEALEYFQGLPNYGRSRRHILRLLNTVYPTTLSLPILERYGALRRRMRPPGGPGLIGDIDAFIAATAIQHRLTLVTTDSDLTRVPDLQVMIVSFRP